MALSAHERAAPHAVGGEFFIVLKVHGGALDPLFTLAEARTLGLARETVFLGLLHDAPRFGVGIDPAAIEALKARADLKLIDLRSIAVQGAVDTVHDATCRSQSDPRLARASSLLSQLRRADRAGRKPAGGATARSARPSIFRAPIRW